MPRTRQHGSGRAARRSRRRVHRPKPAPARARSKKSSAAKEWSGVHAEGFRVLVDGSDEGMILANGEGYIIYANAACEPVFGVPARELVGRLGFDLCRPDHLPIAQDAFDGALEGHLESASCVLDAVNAQGGFRTVSVKIVNHLESPGVAAMVVHLRETQRAKTVDEPYRPLFEKALIGLGVADLEGNLLEFNDEMLKPGGYTREDIRRLGNVSRLYARHSDRARVLEILLQRGVVWREEVPFVRKDGSTYDTLLSLTPVRFRGQPCLYAMVEDVTQVRRAEKERQQLEARLWQARKLEAVGRMTAEIAHDFGNILEILLSSAELAAHTVGSDASEARKYVTEVREQALHARAMVGKLLGYSRTAPLSVEATELGALTLGMREMVERLVGDGVVVEVTVKEEVTALCDPQAVERMMLNLVSNADDAMRDGGTLEIVVEPFEKTESRRRPPWLPERDFACLSVADTGEGMDADTLARALEPFFTTKSAGAGTGLGLPMVFGLVKQQGGYLDLAGSAGKGTTARLFLPIAD